MLKIIAPINGNDTAILTSTGRDITDQLGCMAITIHISADINVPTTATLECYAEVAAEIVNPTVIQIPAERRIH